MIPQYLSPPKLIVRAMQLSSRSAFCLSFNILILRSLCECLFVFFLNKLIYLFLAALGLRCCAWAFSSCGERRLFFVAVRGLFIAVASLVAEHGLQARGPQQLWLTSSTAQAQ